MKSKSTARRSDTDEVDAAARLFDREDYEPKFLKPPPGEKRRHDAAAKRARCGRPTIGAGAKRIQITVERNLLAVADRRAREESISRSELIARGLRLALAT